MYAGIDNDDCGALEATIRLFVTAAVEAEQAAFVFVFAWQVRHEAKELGFLERLVDILTYKQVHEVAVADPFSGGSSCVRVIELRPTHLL
jgi:hypothetical protein